MGFFCIIPSIIGIIVIIKYTFLFIDFIRKHILTSHNNLKEKYGDGFVIITGGSRGIGLSFAKEFLKANFKICLISSNKGRLEKVRKDLLDLYPYSIIKIIDFNLDQFYSEETINKLKERINFELKGEDISILLNNTGVAHDGNFNEISDKNVTNILNVNIYGLTILTKIIIEYMKKRIKRSLIIGSGSFDAQFRCANRVVYCSSKAYVEAFYEGLARDFPDKFDFTLIEIGPVRTDMNKKSYPLMCSPDEFASECIKLVGKYKFIQGCRKHAILKGLISIPLVDYITRIIDKKISKEKKLNWKIKNN